MDGPALTVDVVIEYPDGDIILIKRRNPPFEGTWALPGGFVEVGETVEKAAVREAKEETGLRVRLDRLVGVYSDPNRDPRGHTVSVVFHGTPEGGTAKAASDASDVIKCGDFMTRELAFDHKKILSDTFPDKA